MKVFAIVNNYAPSEGIADRGWYLIADSAVSNTGKPFYLPEFVGPTVVSLTIAVRFSRLGKYIDRKFAPKYFSEFAPALHFHLPEYAYNLRSQGLPEDASRSFDKSLIIDEFVPKDQFENVELRKNGESAARFSLENLHDDLEELIAKVSVMNTIKMGDLLLPALSGNIEIREGDLLEVFHGSQKAFHVRIK